MMLNDSNIWNIIPAALLFAGFGVSFQIKINTANIMIKASISIKRTIG